MDTKQLVELLLTSIAPKCYNCIRAATMYVGKVWEDNNISNRQYCCDIHKLAGTRDLPLAEVIREANRIVDAEVPSQA